MPLRTGLFAYYSLGEASGDALDAHSGGYHLTASNNPGTATGRVGNARTYSPASMQVHYTFSGAIATAFSMGDVDFGVGAWVKLNSKPAAGLTMAVFTKDTSAGVREWGLDIVTAGALTQARFFIFSGGATNTFLSTTHSVLLGTGNWYHIVGWHDSVNNQIGITVNTLSPALVATGGVVPNTNNVTGPWIGARNYPTVESWFDGTIDEVACWKGKFPNANEREDLFNDGRGLSYAELSTPDAPFLTITDNMAAWWAMDEASGDALDARSGAYPLTNNNSVGSAAGKVATARTFNGTNQSLSRASSSGLVVGTDPWMWAGWVKLNNLTATHSIAGKHDGSTAAGSEWHIYHNATTDVPTLAAYQGSSAVPLAASTVLAAGTWYYVIAGYDSVTSLMQISVNGSTAYGALVGGVNITGAAFVMGGLGANWLNGALDECVLWTRRLAPWERRWMYNAGAGRSYAQVNVRLLDNLQAYWPCDEASGNFVDAHGSSHLTDNNTVTATTGILNGCRVFTSANSEFADCADNAATSFGDEPMTIAGWFYNTNVAATAAAFGKWGVAGSDPTLEYCLRTLSGFWRLDVGNGTTKTTKVSSTGPTGNVWYLVAIMHDPVANLIGISVNAGAWETIAHTTGVFNSTNPFTLGRPGSFVGQYWPGRMDEIGIWRRVLTMADLAVLYGGGVPPGYASFLATLAARCPIPALLLMGEPNS